MPRLAVSRKRGEKLVVRDQLGNEIVLIFTWRNQNKMRVVAEGSASLRVLRGELVGHHAEGTEIFGAEGGKVLLGDSK